MPLIGYGKDSLTLAAVTVGLPSLLVQLNDSADPRQALVLYRPGFGRRLVDASDRRHAEFGEFAAIVGTASAVYLIETMWSSKAELQAGLVTLGEPPIRRHRVFQQLLASWRTARPADWGAFMAYGQAAFEGANPTMTLAPVGSALARDLESALRQLAPLGNNIRSLLLLGSIGEELPEVTVDPATFTLVRYRASLIGGAGFVDLTPVLTAGREKDRFGLP